MLRGCTLQHASRRCAPAETPPRRDRGPPFAARLARRYARLYAYAASQGNAAKPGKIRYGVTRLTPSAPLRGRNGERRIYKYIQARYGAFCHVDVALHASRADRPKWENPRRNVCRSMRPPSICASRVCSPKRARARRQLDDPRTIQELET